MADQRCATCWMLRTVPMTIPFFREHIDYEPGAGHLFVPATPEPSTVEAEEADRG